jgi:hypothetical protein
MATQTRRELRFAWAISNRVAGSGASSPVHWPVQEQKCSCRQRNASGEARCKTREGGWTEFRCCVLSPLLASVDGGSLFACDQAFGRPKLCQDTMSKGG